MHDTGLDPLASAPVNVAKQDAGRHITRSLLPVCGPEFLRPHGRRGLPRSSRVFIDTGPKPTAAIFFGFGSILSASSNSGILPRCRHSKTVFSAHFGPVSSSATRAKVSLSMRPPVLGLSRLPSGTTVSAERLLCFDLLATRMKSGAGRTSRTGSPLMTGCQCRPSTSPLKHVIRWARTFGPGPPRPAPDTAASRESLHIPPDG